jgi:hypothetical protein
VLLPVSQREKNKKDRRRQGKQVLQIIGNTIGSRQISVADILSSSFFSVTEIHATFLMLVL